MSWFTDALEVVAGIATWTGSRRLIRLTDKRRSEGFDYLLRYYLFRTPWGSVFLHRFLAPDIDRFHDHPWNWCSIMLAGGYTERMLDGTGRNVWPGQITFRAAETFHMVTDVEPDGGTWTLFLHGKRRRIWGELVDGKWVAIGGKYGNRLKGWGFFPQWDKGLPGEHDD